MGSSWNGCSPKGLGNHMGGNSGLERHGDALPRCWKTRLGTPGGGGGKDTLAVLSPWLECQTLQWLHCQILNSWLHCQILNSWLNCQILNSWLHCQIMNLWFDWQLLNLWLHSPNLLDWLPCQILIYHRHWNWNPAHLRSLLRPHQHLSHDPSHQKH